MSVFVYRTMSQRDAEAAAKRRADIKAIETELFEFARATGGRFVLFGSSASDRVRFDSDVDLLIDFPDESVFAAWEAAELACAKRGVPLDALPLSWAKSGFLESIRGQMRSVG
jgi:predicted nucleotidyltransferase